MPEDDNLFSALLFSSVVGLLIGIVIFVTWPRSPAIALATTFPTPESTAVTRIVAQRIVASPTPLPRPTQLPSATPLPTATATATPLPTAKPSATPTVAPTATTTSSAPLRQEELIATLAPLAPPTQTPTEWIVIIGGYTSMAGAIDDIAQFEQAGYKPIILLRDGTYRAGLIGFIELEAAITVRNQIRQTLRSSAYLQEWKLWCPQPVTVEDYIDCMPTE